MPRDKGVKKSKLPLIMTIFIALLMVMSVAGYNIFGSSSDVTVTNYNGYKVRDFGDHVEVKIGGKYVPFTTNPQEAELVNIEPAVIDNIKGTKQIYITFNPDQTKEALQQIDYNRFEFGRQLAEQFSIYAVQGITSTIPSLNLPQITCANATQFVPVIELRESNKTAVVKEKNNCIILEASNPNDFTRLRERIIYGLYGVLK